MLTFLLAFSAAQAQDLTAIDADPFDPAASMLFTNGTVQGESAQLMGEGISMGLVGNLAENLVVLAYDDGTEQPVLGEVVNTTLYGGYTYSDLFRVDVMVPIYAYAEAPLAPYRAPAMGDVKLQGTIPLYSIGDEFNFAVVPSFALPTGTKRALLHRGVHGGIDIVGSGEYQGFGYLLNLGTTLGPADTLGSFRMGSTFDTVVGTYYRVDDNFRLGGDVDLRVGLPTGDDTQTANTLGTGHLFAQAITDQGVTASIGAGTGIIAGIGAPEYRVYLGAGYAPITRDTDKDGYKDDVDSCPLEPEDFDDFDDLDGCPEADNDADGLVDTVDRCINDPEDFDEFEDDDGCPEDDNDLDTVLDVDDKCPMEPGLPELDGCPKPPDADGDGLNDDVDECPAEPGPEKTNGCPDRDADLVPDYRDRCPDDPRPAEEDPQFSDGCPKRVFYSGKSITITDKVLFDSGRSSIKAESLPLLDEVAAVFKSNTWIKKVEVGGHTDSQGGEEMNQRLSEKRAAAVVTYLKTKGVQDTRIVSKGYGELKPIQTNRTPIGRAANRRVEFNILEQTPPKRERAFVPEKDATTVNPEAGKTRETPSDSTTMERPGDPPAPMGPRPSAADKPAEGADTPDEGNAAPDEGAAAPADPDKPWDTPVEPGETDLELVEEAFAEPLPPPPDEDEAKPGRRGKKRKKGKKKGDTSDLPDELDPLRLMTIEPPVDPTEPPAPWDEPEEPRTGEGDEDEE